MNSIAVIGGGIAGLTAAVLAQKSGFNVTVYEKEHSLGGLSASWNRNGYHFEGGIQSMTGTNEKQPLNQMWQEIRAINNDEVKCHDPYLTWITKDGEKISLYRNVKMLKKHLLSIAPEDTKAICTLCKDIERFKGFGVYMTDVKGVKAKQKSVMKMSYILGMLPAIPRMMKIYGITTGEYASAFKNNAIKSLLLNIIDNNCAAPSLLVTLGGFSAGDGGYPIGGSQKMVERMEEYFLELGGTVNKGIEVDSVLVEKNMIKGLRSGDSIALYDSVIVAYDALVAIPQLFSVPLKESWITDLMETTKTITCTFVSLGIEDDMNGLPNNILIPCSVPISIGDEEITSLSIRSYAGYNGYAPKGCTAATIILIGNSYQFWKEQKKNGTYQSQKESIANLIIENIGAHFPKLQGKITTWDIATPLSFERYTNSFEGSYMTVMKPGDNSLKYPARSESIQNLYFAGQRMQSPGGLPMAALSARRAVQHLCIDNGKTFEN